MKILKIAYWIIRLSTDPYENELFTSMGGSFESYLKMNTIKDEMCFCIGETTGESLENKKIKNIIIADKPSVENVISDVLEYYKAP